MWNEHLYIAKIKQTLERIFVFKPEHPSEFWLWTKTHNTVGSNKTSLAASAVPETAVPALQSKGGRLRGCLSAAGTTIPCPSGSTESSELTLHSTPHLSPFHLHSASNFTFCQKAKLFATLLLYFGHQSQEALSWLCKAPVKFQGKA